VAGAVKSIKQSDNQTITKAIKQSDNQAIIFQRFNFQLLTRQQKD
jgi:hypothetical protein